MNIQEILTKNASLFPDKPALVFEGKVITFGSLRKDAFHLAWFLVESGIRQSDKIAVFLSNTPSAVISFLGVFLTGASIVPLDFMLTEQEVIDFINHSKARVLIVQPRKGIDLERIKERCPGLRSIILQGGQAANAILWENIFSQSQEETKSFPYSEKNLCAIFYTSGSTGHPKGVMLAYQHLGVPVETVRHFLGFKSDDIFLCGGVPFSHLGGLDYILFMIAFGSTLVLMERFQPFEFLKQLQAYSVTVFCIVPAMYIAILSLKEYEKFCFPALRYAVVFGAPSSPELLKRFSVICPNANLLNGWGMTETAAPNGFSPFDLSKLDSIGDFSFNMEAQIVNEQGLKLGRSEQGELWVKGKGVMLGYYQEPELTKEALTDDGWLKTGDIARIDENGLYYIVGRKKEMIKVAGEIVFAPEVEAVIQRHPQVQEAAVIGVPDALRGEVPHAFVVLKPGGALTEDILRSFLKEVLAHFKIPHRITFLETLPKNRVGKIDKQFLQKQNG